MDNDRTPSQEHDTNSIDGLVESTKLQAANIEMLVGGFAQMGDQLQERPTKKGVWKIVSAVAAVLIAIVLTLSYLSYDSSHNALDEIKGCTTPGAECYEQDEADSKIVRGQIACNQEKVLYFVYAEVGYEPLKFCAELINTEIDRLGGGVGETTFEKVDVKPGVLQVPPLKDTFLDGGNAPE